MDTKLITNINKFRQFIDEYKNLNGDTAGSNVFTIPSPSLLDSDNQVLNSQLSGHYNFTDDATFKIFFDHIAICNTPKSLLYFTERQADISGLHLDFDIVFDTDMPAQVSSTPHKFINISKFCIEITRFVINAIEKIFKPDDESKYSKSNKKIFSITSLNKKLEVKILANNKCKLGIHQDYNIKLSKIEKLLLIDALIGSGPEGPNKTIIDLFNKQIITEDNKANITIKEEYKKNYLDRMCVSAPCRFLKSLSAKSVDPKNYYDVKYVYGYDTTDNSFSVETSEYTNNSKINFIYECSTNVNGDAFPKILYKVKNPAILDKYRTSDLWKSAQNMISKINIDINMDNELNKLLSQSNLRIIKNLVMELPQQYSEDFKLWNDVVASIVLIYYDGHCAKTEEVTGTEVVFKKLAEDFSKKSLKFAELEFNRIWDKSIQECRDKKLTSARGLGIKYIKAELKKHHPDRFYKIISQDIDTKFHKIININYLNGQIKDSHFADILSTLMDPSYKVFVDKQSNEVIWYYFVNSTRMRNFEESRIYKWMASRKNPTHLYLEIREFLDMCGIKLTETYNNKLLQAVCDKKRIGKELAALESENKSAEAIDAKTLEYEKSKELVTSYTKK
jgi:hypothetical protein